jgi:predicted kinase
MALALMCGLSFAGKSTFASGLTEELGAQLISLDLINAERGLYGGQGIPLAEWAATGRIAHERVDALLRQRRHVVVDDTGSPRFLRDEWRATAEKHGCPFFIVWVRIDPELQRERVLANRSKGERHDVIDTVMADHVAGFEPPVNEDPLIVDAHETRDERRIREVADAIRLASVSEGSLG